MTGRSAADWRSPHPYAELLVSDRRAFAWEWLRRSKAYRQGWTARAQGQDEALVEFGLLGWVDPDLATPFARPIWSVDRDPHVLHGRPAERENTADDLFDIRTVAAYVSVEIGPAGNEHWLLSDGRWAIRLDLHDGTLLGGPLLVEHRVTGLQSARPKLESLRQFVVLAEKGRLPGSMMPKERKAAHWIMELRVGDALLAGASQQAIARAFFGNAIAPSRWRVESASYRLRVQRLVKAARRNLAEPLAGPWFD